MGRIARILFDEIWLAATGHYMPPADPGEPEDEMNAFTEIRQALEGCFAPMTELVKRIGVYQKGAINFDDPTLVLATFLRVDPLGGPCDPHYTAGAVRMSRKFRVFFSIGVGDMNVEQLEEIDTAVAGCVLAASGDQLGLSYVQDVRWRGGDYAMFVKDQSGKKDAKEEEMWVGLGTVEIDARFTRAEVAGWKPDV